MQKNGRLYLNKYGIIACKKREGFKILYRYNAIVLTGHANRWKIQENYDCHCSQSSSMKWYKLIIRGYVGQTVAIIRS